jgi:DNA-binding MarR family transcriptional regulator
MTDTQQARDARRAAHAEPPREGQPAADLQSAREGRPSGDADPRPAPDGRPSGDAEPARPADDQHASDAAARALAAMQALILDNDRRRSVAEATGISFARSRALRRLVQRPLRMSELAAKLATDKPYTTLIVDDLVRRGLVERTTDPDDRRCKLVSLTETGRAMALRAQEILAQPPEGLFRLTPAELETLAALLEKAADRPS